MNQQILNANLPLLVYNPTRVFDLAYFEAVHAAGALPVLDTEMMSASTATQALDALEQKGIAFGIRVFAESFDQWGQWLQPEYAGLELVVLAYHQPSDLDTVDVKQLPCPLFVEAVDIDMQNHLDRLMPNGLIVKGNEAPGKVSAYSSFVLMQYYLEQSPYPVFVHGGVGWHSAAGVFAAGGAGVVLDDQLYLAEQAPLSAGFKKLIAGLDENDSAIVGRSLHSQYRFFSKLATQVVKNLKQQEAHLQGQNDADKTFYQEIRQNLAPIHKDAEKPLQCLFYLGQDAIFAKQFAASGSKVEEIIHHFFRNIGQMLAAAEQHDPLVEDSDFARAHQVRYPIFQGPMANVSDNADFARQVYDNGALPFMAMGSLPADLAETILVQAKEKVPQFGAGLIGIEAMNQSLSEHLAAVDRHNVAFALFAAGRPGQVKKLASTGTIAYLHTPALSMLENAIANDCKRFIFEGSEAGGHVGSLLSLVLWEQAIARLEQLDDDQLAETYAVFAGGIGTRSGSHFISGLTSRLAARGAKIGIQVGTAYLFSREIVACEAIKDLYQQIICKNNKTILLGETVGLASRTVGTPFCLRMMEHEYQRLDEGISLHDRKTAFEKDNIGSLLIGAKAFCPDFDKLENDGGPICFLHYDEKEQFEKGNFMVGDGLAFRQEPVDIAQIHQTFFKGKNKLTAKLDALELASAADGQLNDEIAIIGMGCIYPDAHNTDELWQNILSKRYSIREMPKERLDPALYYDEDPKAEDKTYTKIAGHVHDFVFDYEKLGYTEDKAAKLSRSQQMVLQTAYQAMESAGYLTEDMRIRPELQKRTAVIVATCLSNELTNELHLKYYYPEIRYHLDQIEAFAQLSEEQKEQVLAEMKKALSGRHTYEPVHSASLNIEASRIAHHMGIEGLNYVVDAACATSFAAIDCAIKELLGGGHDMVIVGGLNTNLAPEPFVGFAKMGALSAKGSYPFDERASGFVLGEGAGVVVLKRARDACRDGDRILGILKSMGSGSDGKGKAIAAPSQKGQELTLQRCYQKMRGNVTPDDIDYIEAHGTATLMGDLTETETLKSVYQRKKPIGVSSIKSQIGHLLGGAGMAGVIKVLLAMAHRTLPPNGPFENLSSRLNFKDTGLYIIDRPTEWPSEPDHARKAAVSSYGFGGINYHCVIEEYTEQYQPLPRHIFAAPEHNFNDDRIVFAGAGVVLPGARNCEQFWNRLKDGQPVYTSIPEERFHNEYYALESKESTFHIPNVPAGMVNDYQFDNKKYRIPPMAARFIDRAQIFGLDAAKQAIDQAGLGDQLSFGNETAVILGTISGEKSVENVLRTRIPLIEQMIHSMAFLPDSSRQAIAAAMGERLKDRYDRNNEDTIPGLLSNIVSARISKHYGTNGANFVVDGSCASAFIAIDLAAKGLRSKDFECVLTGGVDTNLYPTVILAFKRLGLLAEKEVRFFDQQAEGYVMGEGAAILAMTTYGYARRHNMPILAEFKALNMRSSVPDHLLSPSEKAYAATMADCYGQNGMVSREIDHLDVFGVSNSFLDLIEKQALEKVFGHPLRFGNVKTQFGYFKAANPAVALTKMVLMARHKYLLPNFAYRKETSLVNEKSCLLPSESALDVSRRNRVLLASNVNGIGGNHGHMVVGTLPARLQSPAAAQPALPAQPAIRQAPSAPQKAPIAAGAPSHPPLVALLSGQGCQHPGMMKELYAGVPAVAQIMDTGERVFKARRGTSLLEMMFAKDARLNQTENTQPAVFLSTAALYHCLTQRGFSPQQFIGHSVGEYSALYCSGMLGFEAAMELICKRSEYMLEATEKEPGKIMVVFRPADEVAGLIQASGIDNIYVTNKNSMKQTAVSGAAARIAAFCDYLKAQKVLFKSLALSGAFHTPLFQSAADKMAATLANVHFQPVDFTRVVSNTTARPYPADEKAVKELLVRQIVSPVEFVASVQQAAAAGPVQFVEVGPNRLLSNLLKDIPMGDHAVLPVVDVKSGQMASWEQSLEFLKGHDYIHQSKQMTAAVAPAPPKPAAAKLPEEQPPAYEDAADFEDFLARNESSLKKVLYQEFQKQKEQRRIEAFKRFNFYTGQVKIAGVSVGLPGSGSKVFNDDNFDRILTGYNFIEPLSEEEKERILDMNITRVYKEPDGKARFVDIASTQDVIQLAGKLGYFSLKNEYGIGFDYDITIKLAIAAGLEALKDANIPLVMNYRETAKGRRLPEGYALPADMRDGTGVILTSLFPGFETLIDQMNNYYYNKFYVRPYKELENIYYHLMAGVSDPTVKEQITDWFFKIKQRRKKYGSYQFDRSLLHDVVPLGSAHFAQLIRARGPNMQMSGACASTTQAVGVAEDWIRTGRCERVIIIGGEAATSEVQSPWIASGFLAIGAASVEPVVSDAAKPFDADRNGTILGSGAVGMVVERDDCLRNRGLKGQAEVLGTYIGNSAFHATRIDVHHLTREMGTFMRGIEQRYDMNPADYADKMVFMSHETFTPARGGSADAEVEALRATFPENYRQIVITNTKGFTGHTLGAAIEDAVLVKALQKGILPPIANLTSVPENFDDLRFSKREQGNHQYGLHFSAGFGSHFAFLFLRRVQEAELAGNETHLQWLKNISGLQHPELTLVNNTLCILPEDGHPGQVPIPTEGADPTPSAPEPTAAKPLTATAAPASPEVLETISRIIAEQTGYTLDMLEKDLDLEADLGIDTVKQVEVFGKVAGEFGLDVPEDLKLSDLNTIAKLSDYIAAQIATPAQTTAAPGPSSAANSGAIIVSIRKIIAAQTGYTEDMLEDDLDLEADLGIDTVKQVEVFGKVAGEFGLDVPEDLKLSDLNTIAKLSDYIAGQVQMNAPMAAPSLPAATTPALQTAVAIRRIIAEQTGYTEDMLEDDLDLEADLGIDTVKQVEVFGKVAGEFGLDVPEDLKLSDLNTIAKLSDYIAGQVQMNAPMAAPGQPDATAPSSQTAETVRRIIAEQTGYTEDMLEDDLDLEADLGIDTVKQVEVFGKVATAFSFEVPEDLKLSDLNTIAKLSAYIQTQVSPSAPPADPKEQHPETGATAVPTAQDPADSTIRRMAVTLQRQTNSAAIDEKYFSDRTLLITIDEHGFGSQVAKAIQRKGGRAITIGTNEADYTADLKNPDQMAALIEKVIAVEPAVSGLLHLAPLSEALDGNADPNATMAAKVLFAMLQKLAPVMARPGSLVSQLTFESVVFAYKAGDAPISPVLAGLAGMLKTARKEYPDCRFKVVDVSDPAPIENMDAIVETYLAELASDDHRLETGHDPEGKVVPKLTVVPVEHSSSMLADGDTVVVTGGARGITFEILKALAQSGPLQLVILGRSDPESLANEFCGPDITESQVFSRMKTEMVDAKPVKIRQAVDRIMKLRETRDNLANLQRLGAKVAYHPVDVVNADGVAAALGQYESIQGIIHAAGLEESQWLEKKSADSFARVFDTKVIGMQNLLAAVAGKPYRFLVAFSSVTARFGNEGQIDYTGANDMLAKIVLGEQRRYPDRRYKVIDWTAWDEVGMATAETVRKVLEDRGMAFLPLKQGVDMFLEELTDQQHTEVVISGIDTALDPDGLLAPIEAEKPENTILRPFLDEVVEQTPEQTVYQRLLDPARDLFLADHSREGVPIFLGATGIETMAEAASQLVSQNRRLTTVTDFRIPYGIKILKNRPKEIIISARPDAAGDIFDCQIRSQFKNPRGIPMGKETLHYQGTYHFAEKAPEPVTIDLPDFTSVEIKGSLHELIYHPQRLFMEELFKTIEEIVSLTDDVLVTRLRQSSRKAFFSGDADPRFDLNVYLLDAMFQTGGVLEFFGTQRIVLPYAIQEMTIYKPVMRDQDYLCVTKRTSVEEDTTLYALDLVDNEGQLAIRIENFRMIQVGRLSAEHQIKDRIEKAGLKRAS